MFTLEEFKKAALDALNAQLSKWDDECETFDAALDTFQELKQATTPFGTINIEDEWGGEGEGDQYGYVIKFVHTSGEAQYLSVNGHYDSWQGCDFDYADVRFVEPTEKTIRVWAECKSS